MTDAQQISDEQLRSMIDNMRSTTEKFGNDNLFYPVLVYPLPIILASIIMIGSVIIHQSTGLLKHNQGLSNRQRYLLTVIRTAHIVIIVLNALNVLLLPTMIFFLWGFELTLLVLFIIIMGSIILSIVLISIMFANNLLMNMKWLLGVQGLNALLFVIWCILNFVVGAFRMTLFVKKYILHDPQFQKDLSIIFEAIALQWDEYKDHKKFLQSLRREFTTEK